MDRLDPILASTSQLHLGTHVERLGHLDFSPSEDAPAEAVAVQVGDPGLLDGVEASILPGRYEIVVATAGFLGFRRVDDQDSMAEKRVAALIAVRDGGLPVSFSEVGAYGVDCGMGGIWTMAFPDRVFEQLDNKADGSTPFDAVIDPVLSPAQNAGKSGAIIRLEAQAAAVCSSGFGDGVYPVFVGTNDVGEPVAIVTVFVAPEVAE